MTINPKNRNRLTVVLLAIFLLSTVFCVFVGASANIVYATNTDVNFDKTDVLEDLESATVNGEDFDISNFPHNPNGTVRLLLFAEYCYSPKPELQGSYGLYLYIYNPTAVAFDIREANKVQLATEYDNKGVPTDYSKFNLEFLSKSERNGFINLFYKFKVIDTERTILKRVNTYARQYDISGVELVSPGAQNATDYTVGTRYTYYGFAEGMNNNLTSSLGCDVKEIETISLDLGHTFFRTGPSNKGVNFYHELNSVYFSIPNNQLQQFGKLQRIKAEWWEYKTQPIIITTNSGFYHDMRNNYIGQTIPNYSSSNPYSLWYGRRTVVDGQNMHIFNDWGWNVQTGSFGLIEKVNISVAQRSNFLPYIFLSDESITEYGVSREELTSYIYSYNKSNNNGNLQFNGRNIRADLFTNSVDAGRTRGYNPVVIDVDDDKYDMLSYSSTHGFWDNLMNFGLWNAIFGNPYPNNPDYKSVVPIYEVQDADIVGSWQVVSDKLFIEKTEDAVNDFKAYYQAEKQKGNKVHLFRFAHTEYFAVPLHGNHSGGNLSGNHYLAQQTVFFDFDIIWLTFNRDGVYTLIPVVASPIDIINSTTPPVLPELLNPFNDILSAIRNGFGNLFGGSGLNGIWDFVRMIIAIVALVICAAILIPVLVYVLPLIFKLIAWPFKQTA
ncbi:MAG: hypothetical protein FWD49_07615, partial [Firmicutes bacterium]|nr:hypothetical protein [Bacillota bacterium]